MVAEFARAYDHATRRVDGGRRRLRRSCRGSTTSRVMARGEEKEDGRHRPSTTYDPPRAWPRSHSASGAIWTPATAWDDARRLCEEGNGDGAPAEGPGLRAAAVHTCTPVSFSLNAPLRAYKRDAKGEVVKPVAIGGPTVPADDLDDPGGGPEGAARRRRSAAAEGRGSRVRSARRRSTCGAASRTWRCRRTSCCRAASRRAR